jgi:hypothetical protein
MGHQALRGTPPLLLFRGFWFSGCKYGFIPYLRNNWIHNVSTIVTF